MPLLNKRTVFHTHKDIRIKLNKKQPFSSPEEELSASNLFPITYFLGLRIWILLNDLMCSSISESSCFIEAKLSKTELCGTSVGAVEDEALMLFSSVQFVIVTHSTIPLTQPFVKQRGLRN